MPAVVVFIAVYTIGLTAYGISVDSELTYVYLGLTLLLVAVFGVFHYFARFPTSLLWVLAFVGLLNTMGGVVLVDGSPLYASGMIGPVPFDKLFHAAAGFALTFVAWHVLELWAGEGYDLLGLIVMNFLVVMGGGAVVEVAELIGSSIGDVSVGDYGNNALDLVANAVGAIAGCVIIYIQAARREPEPA